MVAPFSAGIPFSAEMTPSVVAGRDGGEGLAQETWQICNGLAQLLDLRLGKAHLAHEVAVCYLRWRARFRDSTKSSPAQVSHRVHNPRILALQSSASTTPPIRPYPPRRAVSLTSSSLARSSTDSMPNASSRSPSPAVSITSRTSAKRDACTSSAPDTWLPPPDGVEPSQAGGGSCACDDGGCDDDGGGGSS